ncbi:RICIN domain-containing protein [Plectonema radiosum NIES-515]|uniref:RICIN domain-containing protein n=1 Tax=Plectonema radiosum NIES-515 TaxID=2986073 RepID=A0ABT3ASA5_9CYAN|nr:H-type lectin domain-containing protein [Plectonema radiosum]MCV3212003.1 RICIN domain-containing protein [Plectonema radiosum NIES-515]
MATNFSIISKRSGKALDLQNGAVTDNNPIVQYTKNGGVNQQWILEPDISTLVSATTTNSLDFTGTQLTSTVNGKSATIDIASIIADVLYIQTGEVYNGYLDSQGSQGWTLNSGSGERTFTTTVKFNSPFRVPPQVSLAISGQDVGIAKNIRLQVIAKNITVDGFELTYKTWFDTVVFSAWATWTAIGVKP